MFNIGNVTYIIFDMNEIKINSYSLIDDVTLLSERYIKNPCIEETKKERTGYKKYTKKMMKKDSKFFKVSAYRKK